MLYEQLQEALSFLKEKASFQPKFGIILGTGLGQLADDIQVSSSISYKDIPHFPVSTVESHKGQLVFGHLDGIPVVAMVGRFHYYEGYSMKEVTFPVRVLKLLGIDLLVISNAAGGTNPDYQAGDIVFVRDHINMQPENPLRGPNDERLGIRFPDMLATYDRQLNAKAIAIAKSNGIRTHEGVYYGLQGPNLETPAEYQFIHRVGGDLVGMSTIPEVLVARHMNLAVFVLSVVTNKCFPLEAIRETTLEEVIETASSAEPKMRLIVKELLKDLVVG
ncbi:MAG: purine-nucleoside phosphorylase [Saprospiraceae bacterium]|nr:purine-nucleoside phosphorylase [Saprospiraceae bacterium]